MDRALRVLHLEDVAGDATLVRDMLEAGGIVCDITRIQTREEFVASLEKGFDVILADYSLPSFDGMSALKIAVQRSPAVPFIFVSGTLGEEIAIGALKTGATDYVLKERLSSLVPSVQRALREVRERIEHKRAEQAARAANARLEGILNIALDAIISVDSQQRIILFNQGAEKVFGYAQAEVIGRPLDLLLPRPFEDVHRKHIEDFARSPDSARIMGQRREVSGRRKDGGEFPADASISKLDLGGELVFTAILRDVTEQKRAEEALRQSETYLAEAQRLTHTGSWAAVAPSGKTTYWSEEMFRIHGVDPQRKRAPDAEEFFSRIIHPDDRDRIRQAWEQAWREKAEFEPVYRIMLPGETIRHIEAIGNPVLDEAGELIEYLGTAVDVTERKLAEAERTRLAERLRQAEKMEAIGRLASGIAHDFNNLLGGITAYGEMIFDEAPDGEPRKRYAQNVLTAATRGRDLVEQILTFSRNQRGKRTPTDVCRTVAETLEFVRSSLPASITLHPAIPDQPLIVMGNATQLHQVVMNLCSNAVHAMAGGGALRVSITAMELASERALSHGALRPGHCACMCVEDNGCGMDEATLARIFEPFFTTKEVGRGTGLGLALVYAIVADHAGAIDVKSVPGEGSVFAVYLPLADAPDAG